MNISIYFEEAAQVSVAFVIGAIIGLRAGVPQQAAGFRTMILDLCWFLLIYHSFQIAAIGSTDRIASNIVTGIGLSWRW